MRTNEGELRPSAEALAQHGIEPVVLAEKEGLALINGTDGMLGMLVLALRDLDRLLKLADVAAAMSVEGQLGSIAKGKAAHLIVTDGDLFESKTRVRHIWSCDACGHEFTTSVRLFFSRSESALS